MWPTATEPVLCQLVSKHRPIPTSTSSSTMLLAAASLVQRSPSAAHVQHITGPSFTILPHLLQPAQASLLALVSPQLLPDQHPQPELKCPKLKSPSAATALGTQTWWPPGSPLVPPGTQWCKAQPGAMAGVQQPQLGPMQAALAACHTSIILAGHPSNSSSAGGHSDHSVYLHLPQVQCTAT